MWVPGPGLLAEEGPRAWPGRVRVGVDIVVLFGVVGLVVVLEYAMRSQGTFWEKSKVTFEKG
jgi:hypothetical protein